MVAEGLAEGRVRASQKLRVRPEVSSRHALCALVYSGGYKSSTFSPEGSRSFVPAISPKESGQHVTSVTTLERLAAAARGQARGGIRDGGR